MSDAEKLSNALSAAGRLYDLGDTAAAYKRLSGAVRTFLEPGADQLCQCQACLDMEAGKVKELADLDTWAELNQRLHRMRVETQAEIDKRALAQYNPRVWDEIAEDRAFDASDYT